tara:strand:+ start:4755 stop:10526 length:5772 start_codon:yes stop_codon:yes gene_type:complete
MAIFTNYKSNKNSSILRRGYTLDDLESNEQFQEISERFLTSVGEQSDDIFEYLRDSDFNLYNGMQRAMESGNFNEQQKKDYRYLRSTFDKADMGSLRQYAELIKDSTIDIATDPTLLAAMLLTPVSGGTSLVARQALATGANQGLKNIAKSKITPLQSTGLFALEGATWQGLDNHFRQQTEVNTNLRKLYSNPELVSSAAIGALTGGIFGGLANKNKFFEERLQKLYSDDGYRKEAGSDLVYNLRKKKDAFIAKTIGSPAWRLKTDAEFSPTARLLGQKFTSEFNKSLVNRSKTRLGYSYGEDLAFRRGNYKIGYEAAIEPLYATGRMSPELGEEVLTILRGGQVPGASKAVRDTAKNLRLYFDSIREDAIEVGINVSEIKNYFPRSWNREAIEANPDVFKKLLVDNNIIPEKEVDDVVKGMLNKQNELYSSHSNLLTQARKFENLDDNQFKEFLTNDLHSVTTDYFMNAARTIEHKKHFLSKGSDVKVGGKTEEGNLLFFKQSNEQQFVERFINPIQQELEEFGRTLSTKQQRELIDVYKSITGQVDYYRSDTFQAIYDGTKLANAMAYLPLATVSSLSEAFITLGKAPTSSAIKGMQDAIENSGRIFTTEIGQILKEKHKLTDNEITKEMNSVFLAVDEAMADLTNRLDGEGLQNETLKRGARGFYRLNMLIPWTKTVQLAAFSTGKDLIQSNLKQLSNPTGLSKNKIARLRGELNDLGVDIEKGLAWNNKFGDNVNIAAKEDNFYKNDIIRGAGRFTNGVILQTGREFANVPLFMTNPKLDIFTQFLRYPTVFGNTVLRNFAKETITDTTVNAPKLAAFVAISINVARATNYWRANENERKRIEEESDWRDTLKALQRVGLLGPTEYLLRATEGMAYGQNPLVAGVGTGGPILNDVIGMTLYDRGVLETVARKLPLRGTKNVFDRVVGDIMEEYTGIREPYTPLEKQAKELDKKLGGGFQSTADFVAGIEETDKLFKEIDLDRKLFNIGGRVGRGLQSKLKTIYSKVKDDMGGGSRTEEIFMDSYGNYSPTLKTLTEDSPEDVTGTKLFKWLQQQRSTRGIKQKELDYLEVEEFIKNYEDFNGKQVAQALSDSKLKIIPIIRYSEQQTDKTLEFDKTIFNVDEAVKFLTEDIEGDVIGTDAFGRPQNYIYNEHPNMYLPVGRNAEDYESNPFQMIKLRLTSDEELTEGFTIEDIGEAFAFGNTEVGYQLYFPGLEKSNGAKFDEITDAINDFGAMPMNPTEAKIRINDVLAKLGVLDNAALNEQYAVPPAIHKSAIDENSPGGENYRNFVFTVQGPKTLELKMNRMKYMHFDDNTELKQFGHAVTKDRVLRDGFKTFDTLNVEELQSDFMSNLIDFGIDTPTNRKIAKEIKKESDKTIQILRDKKFELRKILSQLRKNRNLESGSDIMYIRPDGNQYLEDLENIEFDNFLNNEYTEKEIKLLNTFINDWNKTDELNLNVFDDLNKQRDGNTFKINKELNESIKDFGVDIEKGLAWNINEKYAFPQFSDLKYLEIAINNTIIQLNKLNNKYGDPKNLVVDNPIQDDWYKRIIDRLLTQAIKENMDALSIVQSDIINQRYSGQGKRIKDELYNKKYKKYLEKLAKKYNTKFEVLEIDPKNLGDEPFEYFDSYSMEAIDDKAPYNKDELFKVNTLIITDEMKKEILKRGDKSFSTGGLVTGPKVPDTKENPADRKDPNTGLPYSDQIGRLGLAAGDYLKPYQKEIDVKGEKNFIMTEKLFHGAEDKEFKKLKIDKILIPEYVRLQKKFPELSKDISYGQATKNLKEILLDKTKDFESTNRNLARGTNLSKSSASGFYQYIEGSVVPAYNRMERYYGKQNAQNIFGKALINNDSSVLTEEEQDILFIADMIQRKGTDILIAPILFNRDNQAAKKLVLKEHHTLSTKNKDLYNKTIKRADLIWGK